MKEKSQKDQQFWSLKFSDVIWKSAIGPYCNTKPKSLLLDCYFSFGVRAPNIWSCASKIFNSAPKISAVRLKIYTWSHKCSQSQKSWNFEPCQKNIILGQMTNLTMVFHVMVSVYRLVKIWNSPQFPAEFRNDLWLDFLRMVCRRLVSQCNDL